MRISYSMVCEALAARGAVVVSADHPGDELRGWKEWLGVEDAGAGWPAMPMGSELGLRLGRALRYADDETLAALATTEFVAADAVELKELLKLEELPRGELLVVEPDGEVHVAVEALEPLELAADLERYEQDPKAEEKARALAARFGARLRTALFGDAQRVARRLAVHDDRIGPAGMEFSSHADGSDRDLSRCARAYLAAAMRVEEPELRRPWIERLAALGRARYVQGGPVGARWGDSDGCGASCGCARVAPATAWWTSSLRSRPTPPCWTPGRRWVTPTTSSETPARPSSPTSARLTVALARESGGTAWVACRSITATGGGARRLSPARPSLETRQRRYRHGCRRPIGHVPRRTEP